MNRYKKSIPGAIDGIIEKRFGKIMRYMSSPDRNITYFSVWEPSIDIYQLEDKLILNMDISGVPADAITITAEPNQIVISGKRLCTVTGITTVHQLENEYGPFRRIIELPVMVDIDAFTSENINGFLVIEMPIVQETS
jgi:HSP20 family molecular chaperone IbpA